MTHALKHIHSLEQLDGLEQGKYVLISHNRMYHLARYIGHYKQRYHFQYKLPDKMISIYAGKNHIIFNEDALYFDRVSYRGRKT